MKASLCFRISGDLPGLESSKEMTASVGEAGIFDFGSLWLREQVERFEVAVEQLGCILVSEPPIDHR